MYNLFPLFLATLLHASVVDIKTHNVENLTYVLLLLVAVLCGTGSSLLCGVAVFVALLLISVFGNNCIGGGDLKVIGLCCVIVGYPECLVSLAIAFTLAGVVMTAMQKSGRKKMAFVPLLSIGFVIGALIKVFL